MIVFNKSVINKRWVEFIPTSPGTEETSVQVGDHLPLWKEEFQEINDLPLTQNKSWTIKRSDSESDVAQSCPTLCDHVDCSPPGSSVHEIFQARLLEWGAIAFSYGER